MGLKAAKSFICVYVWVWFSLCLVSYSFKAVEVKFWSFLVWVCFCGVSVVYLNVVKIFNFFHHYFQTTKVVKTSIQSQWTCVLNLTKIFVDFNHFLSGLANELKLTLRYACLYVSSQFSRSRLLHLCWCVLCLRSYLCYCFLLLLRSLFVGRG